MADVDLFAQQIERIRAALQRTQMLVDVTEEAADELARLFALGDAQCARMIQDLRSLSPKGEDESVPRMTP